MGLLKPSKIEASFLSSFLGDSVYAKTNIEDNLSNKNSQTIDLLEADVISLAVLTNKDNISNKNDLNSSIDNNIISDNALIPVVNSVKNSNKNLDLNTISDQISVYVVRSGDSLSGIAKMFNVSVNTILVANDMKKNDKLVIGDVLFILPISGIEHTVSKGQTLKSIAKIYKIDVSDVAFYNGINEDSKLEIGDEIIIPGADMLDEGNEKPASNLKDSLVKDKNYYDTHPIQNLSQYFINPVPTGHKTQGLHGPGKRGIDIGAKTGTPIYASASGKVIIARIGWSGGYGNMAILEHPNGTKTLYAHMVKLATKTGAQVSQGEIIGYVGSTGRSTGPHLHFEVFNAKNPGVDWSWAK